MTVETCILFGSMAVAVLFPAVVPLSPVNSSFFNNTSKLVITSNLMFPYTILQDKVSSLNFSYAFMELNNTTSQDGWLLLAFIEHSKIAHIVGKTKYYIQSSSSLGTFDVFLEGKLPGRTTLYFHVKDWVNKTDDSEDDGGPVLDVEKYGQSSWQLFVEREERALDVAFNVVVILLVVTANIGMGAKVDLTVVKAQLRRPLAAVIGLCSQFIFMPLIAFAVAYNLDLDPGVALGLFALGCAPGGSASNAYTFLLEGNVSLSVTMTLVSTLASLGLLPMWLFTLGRIVYSEARVKIPYQNIFLSLVGIIVPVVVGLVLQKKFPKVASFFIRAVKYIVIVFILFVLTVGVYANLFIFFLMSGEVLLAAAALPYLGFILGGLAAFVGRQDLANIITIAVETGIQNTGIPIILLRLSLQGPDRDTSIVAPVASAIFTPIPLIFGILYVQIRKRRAQRQGTINSPPGECTDADNDGTDADNDVRESGSYPLMTDTSDELGL